MKAMISAGSTLLAAMVVAPSLAFALEGERASFPALEVETQHLLIHGATDLTAMRPLIEDFQKQAPNISVEFVDYVTNDLFREAVDACKGIKVEQADILLTSAVDQLVRLANDGCAQAHRSNLTETIPDWANWRDEVFGFTFEPVVFAYDRERMPKEDVPHSHEDLADLLRRKPAAYSGRIGTYDVAASGIGYLLAYNDSRQAPTTYGRVIESLSRTHTVIRCCNNEVLDEIASGPVVFAYNVLGSYAYAAALQNPNLGIVVPNDYTLILSRGAMIPSTATHPSLGKRFLDYLLSPRGRQVARDKAFFFAQDKPLPKGVEGPDRLVDTGIGRPIRIGPALLAAQDEMQRKTFTADWQELINPD